MSDTIKLLVALVAFIWILAIVAKVGGCINDRYYKAAPAYVPSKFWE